MKKERKSSKKVYLIFGIILIVYVVFMSIMNSAPEISSNIDEIQTYDNQEIDLQNLQQYSFGYSLDSILREIGVDDAKEAVCEKDNSYGMTLRVTTSNRRLWICIDDYFEEERKVQWVKDYDSESTLYYYISDDLDYNEPVYSYKTGELLVDKVDGESIKYPIIITTKQLIDEVTKDIDSAKEKYNSKWVEITGTITYISESTDMIGYYLHGERGDNGLKITCWVEDNKAALTLGDTVTFVGKLNEVTTVNNIEIADCEILK